VELVIGAKNPFALTSHNEVQKFKKKINWKSRKTKSGSEQVYPKIEGKNCAWQSSWSDRWVGVKSSFWDCLVQAKKYQKMAR
jgi:hypothetical protein